MARRREALVEEVVREFIPLQVFDIRGIMVIPRNIVNAPCGGKKC
jgi:hypothetical protein